MSSQFIFETNRTVITCRISGMFSTPEVQHVYKHFKTLVNDMKQPFGILMDLREFQGTTPEGFEEAELFNQWLASSELVVKVNLSAPGVLGKIVEQNIPTRSNYHFKDFDEESSALTYLNEIIQQETS